MELRADGGIEEYFHHKNQLLAAFPAVNHRRSIFRLGRDKTDLAVKITHAIDMNTSRVADVHGPDFSLRHECAYFDVPRRQHRDNRASRRHPLAGAKKGVE